MCETETCKSSLNDWNGQNSMVLTQPTDSIAYSVSWRVACEDGAMSVGSKIHPSTRNQTPKLLTSPQSTAEWKFARSVKTPTASETAWCPWWKVILLSGTFQETCPVYPHSWSWLSIKKAPSPLGVKKKRKKLSLNRIPLFSSWRPVFGIGPAGLYHIGLVNKHLFFLLSKSH